MTGKAGIIKDVEGFTGKLKEIVLFQALHLVLSNKSLETNTTKLKEVPGHARKLKELEIKKSGSGRI